jgi:hypothetical protein
MDPGIGTLRAFHGDPAIKQRYVERVRAHAAADEIIHGRYWENGRGCAVGRTIHSSDHRAFEIELGIPRILAHLEDRIFERMDRERAREFPGAFLRAIEPGADLSAVPWRFLIWFLSEILPERDHPEVFEAVLAARQFLGPLASGRCLSETEISEAARCRSRNGELFQRAVSLSSEAALLAAQDALNAALCPDDMVRSVLVAGMLRSVPSGEPFNRMSQALLAFLRAAPWPAVITREK